jgi:NAD(P) transhydrogenase subunit alpha
MVVIGVSREPAGERRVALVPDVVRRLAERGIDVVVQRGAGAHAWFTDYSYVEAGATIVDDVSVADVIVRVGPPSPGEIGRLRPGHVVVGMLAPFSDPDRVREFAASGVTTLALELLPRISSAQSMDALSSQASLAGYRGALIAAYEFGGVFPLMNTAAGTIKPAKVLVLGAGVAGLQAIATVKRLGAKVFGYDIRPETADQIKSVGGTPLTLPTRVDGRGEGGHARQLRDAQQVLQQQELAEAIAGFDVAITAAQVRGGGAPILVTVHAVDLMRPGSLIVDLAGEQGRNCELSVPGQTIVHNGVRITAPLGVPAWMARDASTQYANNISALLGLIVVGGQLLLDFDDPIVRETCMTRGGEVVNPDVTAAIER